MNKKKLLIVGSTGDIGKDIKKYFEENGFDIIAPTSQELDLSSVSNLKNISFLNNIDIDVFIYCAGINFPTSFLDITEDNFEKTLTINTKSLFYLLQKISPNMIKKKSGSILIISSIYGTISRKNRMSYSVSKHAIGGIVKTAALELGEYDININSLSPGFVDTKLTRQNNSPEKIEQLKNKTCLKRLASTQEIAKISYFLCSQDAKYITGQDIIVDGGYTIGGFEE